MIPGIVAGQMRAAGSPVGNLVLNGNQYLSQPLAGRINGPATLLLDFVPSALPPNTGTTALRHMLAQTRTDGFSSPFLNISPGGTIYDGIGMYVRSGPANGVAVSLLSRSSLSAGQRYRVAITLSTGASATTVGTLKAYINGVLKQSGASVAMSRPDEICGTSAAGGYSLTGEFVSMAICGAELSAAQIADIAADDNYDLTTLPGLTDLWVGTDIANGVIVNRVSARPALTLVNKV